MGHQEKEKQEKKRKKQDKNGEKYETRSCQSQSSEIGKRPTWIQPLIGRQGRSRVLAAGWNTPDVAVEALVPEDLDQAVLPYRVGYVAEIRASRILGSVCVFCRVIPWCVSVSSVLAPRVHSGGSPTSKTTHTSRPTAWPADPAHPPCMQGQGSSDSTSMHKTPTPPPL